MCKNCEVFSMNIFVDEHGMVTFPHYSTSLKQIVTRNYNNIARAICNASLDSNLIQDKNVQSCVAKVNTPKQLAVFTMAILKYAISTKNTNVIAFAQLLNDRLKAELKVNNISMHHPISAMTFDSIVVGIYSDKTKVATVDIKVCSKFYPLVISIVDFITTGAVYKPKLRKMKELIVERMNHK